MGAFQVGERDRELLGYLATCRLLSTSQVQRLVFHDAALRPVQRRLQILGGKRPGEGRVGVEAEGEGGSSGMSPVLQVYRVMSPDDGKPAVAWGLSARGRYLAQELLNREEAGSAADVGPAFVLHEVKLNELFVGLVTAVPHEGNPVRRGRGARWGRFWPNLGRFTWASSESARLPWRAVEGEKLRDKLIVPDAIVTVASAKRRFFLEYESGVQPIVASDPKRRGATLAKLSQYERFVRSFDDAAAKRTFYAARFPDGFPPTVVILSHSARRQASVRQAVQEWMGEEQRRIAVEVWTPEEALQHLGRVVYGRDLGKAAPQPAAEVAPAPALPEGSVVLSRSEAELVRDFFIEGIRAIKQGRDLGKASHPEQRDRWPAYPKSLEPLRGVLQRNQLVSSGAPPPVAGKRG